MFTAKSSNTISTGIGIIGLLCLSAILLIVPSGCAIFSRGVVAPHSNPDALSFAEISTRSGVATTSWYRIATPAGWKFTRLDPGVNDGVILEGRGSTDSSGSAIEYTVQRIAFNPAQYSGDVTKALDKYYAYRLNLLNADYAIKDLAIEDKTYRYVIAANGKEQMLSIPIISNFDIIVLSLIGRTGTFSLDAESARALAESFTIDNAEPEQRIVGSLPDFLAVDHRWSWVRDVENGLVISGKISGMPCIVTVTTVPQDQVPHDGRSVTTVFTGADVYRVILESNGSQRITVFLYGDTRSYRLVLDRIPAEAGGGTESWGADMATSDDFLMMIEHYLILDSVEEK